MILLLYITGFLITAIIICDMRRVKHKLLICLLWPIALAAVVLRDIIYLLVAALTRNN